MLIRHLVRSSLLVFFLVGLNKVTGFVKLLLTTNLFGTGSDADALASANQLPELLQAMLLGGALGAALLPIYSEFFSNSQLEKAQRLARAVLTWSLLIAAVVCGVTALVSPWLIRVVLVPGFPPEQQQLTTELMQINLLAMGLLTVSSVTSALLHARKHFLTPALGGVIIDTGQILGLYFLAPTWGIQGVAWGSVAGVFFVVLVQIPPYLKLRIGIAPLLAVRVAGLWELLRLMWPRLVTVGVYQAADLFFIRLASRLSDGAISAFFFAMLVMVAMPKSLIASVIVTVFFPTLAEQFNEGALAQLKQTVTSALRAVLALLIPGALGLIALGPPMIALFFERGEFGSDSTALVYTLVAIMGLRLVAEAAIEVLTVPFYAYHNTKLPMWASIIWMAVSVALFYLLVGPFQVYGLAFATTLAALTLLAVTYGMLRRLIGPLDEAAIGREIARIALASGVMCGVILGTRIWLADDTPVDLGIAIATGGLTYLLVYATVAWRDLRPLLEGLSLPGFRPSS